MGLKSRLLRVLEFKILSPEYRFARPVYFLADRFICFLFPNLRKLDRREDRMEVYAKVELMTFGRARVWMRLIICLFAASAVPTALVFLVSVRSSPFYLPRSTANTVLTLTVFLSIVLLGLAGAPIGLWLAIRKDYRRAIRWELFRRNADRGQCPECLYPLTGLSSPRCPECGTRLDGAERPPGEPSPR